MTLRALALDIDATLIDSSKRIPEFTKSEIHRVVREYGVDVLLVTARGPSSTFIIEEQLGVPCSYATYGGSLVLARMDGKTLELASTSLDDGLVRTVASVGLDAGAHVGIYTRDRWFVSALDYWGLREARNTAVWPSVVDIASAVQQPSWGPVYKIMFRGEPDLLREINVRLHEHSEMAYIHHSRRVLEIVPATAVKLPALRHLANHYSISLDEIIAFGDSAADVEMLENVGVGVIMGNASPSLEVAEHVERTLSHDEDGVGVALRKHFPTDEPFRP
jgi:Cof subfamily protein (haloacid dehalogenase superfamily)